MGWMILGVYLAGAMAFPWVYGKLEKCGLAWNKNLEPEMLVLGSVAWFIILPIDLGARLYSRRKIPSFLNMIYQRAKA